MIGERVVESLLSVALGVNALIFIPQIIRIIKKRSAKSLSIVTFFGFLFTQLLVVLHAFFKKDPLLMWGYSLSVVTCASVLLAAIYFRIHANKEETINSLENINLKEFLDKIKVRYYCKDPTGAYIGANKNHLQYLGMSKETELIGKTDRCFFLNEVFNKMQNLETDAYQHGVNVLYYDSEVMETKNHLEYQNFLFPVKNEKGKLDKVIGIGLDITKLRNKFYEKVDFLEEIIALLPGHVYWLDKNGVYQGCNNLQAKSAGLASRHEIVGKKNKHLEWNIVDNILPEVIDKTNFEIMQSGKPKVIEEPARLKNGGKVIYLSSKVPLRNKMGDVIGLLGISLDITEHKKLESDLRESQKQAYKANKAKDEFLKNMRHDIRTPFSGILNMAQALEHSEVNPSRKKHLGYIIQAAHQLNEYLTEILEQTKLSDGNLPVLFKPFSLLDLLEQSIQTHYPICLSKKLNIKKNFDKNLPNILLGDKYRIQRILLNLLSNASKFTSKGFIEIGAKVAKASKEELLICLWVADTGIGIPEDKYNIIFEQFNRLTSSYSGIYSGSGLGLKTIKQFILELGGEVAVESTLGKGTTFTCLIPCKPSLANIKKSDSNVRELKWN